MSGHRPDQPERDRGHDDDRLHPGAEDQREQREDDEERSGEGLTERRPRVALRALLAAELDEELGVGLRVSVGTIVSRTNVLTSCAVVTDASTSPPTVVIVRPSRRRIALALRPSSMRASVPSGTPVPVRGHDARVEQVREPGTIGVEQSHEHAHVVVAALHARRLEPEERAAHLGGEVGDADAVDARLVAKRERVLEPPGRGVVAKVEHAGQALELGAEVVDDEGRMSRPSGSESSSAIGSPAPTREAVRFRRRTPGRSPTSSRQSRS